LTWKAKINGFEPRLIELAGHINGQMPNFTVSRLIDALNERKKSLKGSRILALGVAYKPDVSDNREAPALEVLQKLHEKGALIYYSDPYVPSIKFDGQVMQSVNLSPAMLRSMDCVVILTDHSVFDYAMVADSSSLILDSRHALGEFSGSHIIRL